MGIVPLLTVFTVLTDFLLALQSKGSINTTSMYTECLSSYQPITLDQMGGIKLMNRTDTKFVTNTAVLGRLLQMAKDDYRVQETDGKRLADYYTVYFDTPESAMYVEHETGHTNRQKLRIRSYVESRMNFLEVKTKNNRDRTKKIRMGITEFDFSRCTDFDLQAQTYSNFLHEHLKYPPETLTWQIENRFDRITLVNNAMTERLTIDTNLRFHNLRTDHFHLMENIVIIELKRNGLQHSPILHMLRDLRIKPNGFSKYCIGTALTNDSMRRNRFKTRLHEYERILHNNYITY